LETPAERKKMGVGFLLAGGRWGSCPTLPYGELRLCICIRCVVHHEIVYFS
jgi:hypothetical protein